MSDQADSSSIQLLKLKYTNFDLNFVPRPGSDLIFISKDLLSPFIKPPYIALCSHSADPSLLASAIFC